MAHAGWRGFRLLLLAAAVGVGLLAVAPEASASHLDIDVEIKDDRLKCDGDSARIIVTTTEGGAPAAGQTILVIHPGGTETVVTNSRGIARTYVTPNVGMDTSFIVRVGAVHDRGPAVYIGRCPLIAGLDGTVSFSALVVDESGRPIRGERVAVAGFSYTPVGTIPPQWLRTSRDGGASWDGLRDFPWEDEEHIEDQRRSRLFCLSALSRYEFATVNGVAAESGDGHPILSRISGRTELGECVGDFTLEGQPVVFGLRRK